ncbi:MAG: gephyrin-like molybdotransferase Glp [Pseudomonadota bacterium]|nr:gephyrin-like molybdotransferase Glp [Pseudomonadota bacterium]
MIKKAEAVCRLLEIITAGKTEILEIQHCLNRVLAQDIFSKTDSPPFDASAMDGYAIKIRDRRKGHQLKVVGEVAAGSKSIKDVNAGEAVRIFTGAPLPKGAECIIIQEDVQTSGDFIKIKNKIENINFIRSKGSDFLINTKLPAATRLTPQTLSLIAAMNFDRISVYVKPRVALITSGDELSEPGKILGENQVVSSNSYGLSAMLESFGAAPEIFPIVSDDISSICETLRTAMSFNLIITVGGASVGKYDLIKSAGTKIGLKLLFDSVAMRPGKPLMGGLLRGTPLIALPGNPVSALICCQVIVQEVIRKMLGLKNADAKIDFGFLQTPLPPNGIREHYMRARTTNKSGQIMIKGFNRQDSYLLRDLSAANALLLRPANDRARGEGELVPYIPIMNYTD